MAAKTGSARAVAPPVAVRSLRIAVWIALVAVIAVLPGGFNRWVLPKDAVLAVAALVGAFGMARGRLPRWFWIVVAGGGILLALSVVFSTAPLAELWGRYPRYEGLVTLPVYLAAVWLGARALGSPPDARVVESLEHAVATVATLLGLLSIIEALGGRPFSSDLARPGAFLGNATDQGLVGAMLLALLVASLSGRGAGSGHAEPRSRQRREVAFAVVGAAFAVATVVLSESRAAIVAAIVGLVVLGALALIGRRLGTSGRTGSTRSRVRWLVFGVPLASLVILSFADPLTRNRILGLSPLSGQTIGDRFAIWGSAWRVLAAHPLLGVGPSGFLDAVPRTYDPRPGSTFGVSNVLDSPHAWPLQFALAGGWPLLVLALAAASVVIVLGVRAWWAAPESERPVLAGALAAILASGVGLATHLTSPGDAILPCFLIGALIAVPAPGAVVRRAGIPLRYAGRAALAAWSLFLVVAASSEIALQDALNEIPQDAVSANSMLNAAQAVRFWDADLPSIAAESYAATTDNREPGSAALAVGWAHRSLAITPGTQASLLALGVGETAEGHLSAAVSALTEAVHDNAANEQAFYRLGVAEALQKNYASAGRSLRTATRLDPTDAAPWNALAYVYQQLGSKTQADAAHAHAVTLGG